MPDDFSAYLDSLSNLGIEPSLDGIRALCRELGEPQQKYEVIQVTGTNGKTSTSRMTQALLTAHGISCGLYLSPHLERYHERMSVDGSEISEADFEEIGRTVRGKVADAERLLGGRRVTQFEVLTAAGLVYFAQAKVKTAVLEVGMGGRWDATSVAAPRVSVITNVTLDHADWLGPGLTQIAFEKSYVMRDKNAAVIGPVSLDAKIVFEERALAEGVRLIEAGKDFSMAKDEAGAFELKTPLGVYPGVALGVAGDWQSRNALMATTAVETYLGRPLDADKVRLALSGVRTPGRAELVEGRPDILLDGAHNEAGVEALAAHLKSEHAGRTVVLLVSVLRDKAVARMVRLLLDVTSDVVFTSSENPRCLAPTELERLANASGGRAEAVGDLPEAMTVAQARAGEEGLVVITGSLYLVGQARKVLKNQGKMFS